MSESLFQTFSVLSFQSKENEKKIVDHCFITLDNPWALSSSLLLMESNGWIGELQFKNWHKVTKYKKGSETGKMTERILTSATLDSQRWWTMDPLLTAMNQKENIQ